MWRVVSLAEIRTHDDRIKAVAKEGAEAHSKVVEVAQQSNDADMLLAVVAALAGAPVVPALIRTAATTQRHDDLLKDAVVGRRAATCLLPELAKELAGPVAPASPLTVDFDVIPWR
jgi:hypothetical protein